MAFEAGPMPILWQGFTAGTAAHHADVSTTSMRCGAPEGGTDCTRRLRILVADGGRDAADTTSRLVALWGHEARTVYDGVSVLLAALEFHPDVLLMDISMPNKDGCQVARQLRQQPRFNKLQMIAITGWADLAHRLLGEAAGFDSYLVKPVEPLALEGLLAIEKARLLGIPMAAPSV